MHEDGEFWLEEYKIVIDQFHKYYDIHVKAFGIFLAVTTVLFAQALNRSLVHLTGWIIVLGIACTAIYVVILVCELTIIKKLKSRRARALSQLTTVEIEDDFHSAGYWSCYIFFGAAAVVTIGWIFMACTAWDH